MPSPPIELFLTTIASQPALRQRQEYILRILQVKKIPFKSYDLASDPKAKSMWKRKAPPDKQQLPGILVGGRFPGPFQDFEEAVECGELDVFLRLKESWIDDDDDNPPPPAAPIGVPGAYTPLEMTPDHLRKKIVDSSPLKGKGGVPVNKRTDMFDVSTELSGYGLQGVQVTEDELRDLVAELGLDGDEAGDLVKGLSFAPEEAKPVSPPKEAAPLVKPTKEVTPEKPKVESVAEAEPPIPEVESKAKSTAQDETPATESNSKPATQTLEPKAQSELAAVEASEPAAPVEASNTELKSEPPVEVKTSESEPKSDPVTPVETTESESAQPEASKD
ncbi:hypothetical protein B0H19DRAFT_1126573 [Mycena capillaripes]|nr:hypothetical protein B0H19DRAFT_1126573 [Mycena capillaripes]